MNNESVDHNQANTGQLAGGQQNDNANSSNQNTNSCYLLLSDLQWKQYLCKSSKQRNLNFIEVGEGEREREREVRGGVGGAEVLVMAERNAEMNVVVVLWGGSESPPLL